MEKPNPGFIEENLADRPVICSVCIATYKRMLLLEKLLNSLKNQVLPDGVNLEIVVVDNDFLHSAEAIVRKFKNTTRIRFYYFNQPEKNISLTRNMAIEKASGDYILFIDDDEYASSEWVSNLLTTIKKFNADGVFGYLQPQFKDETPSWLTERSYYYPPMPPTGTTARYTYTSNCILKSELFKNIDQPFDPQYGITGGGDSHFFAKQIKQGRYFVNSREAVVWEYLPPARAS